MDLPYLSVGLECFLEGWGGEGFIMTAVRERGGGGGGGGGRVVDLGGSTGSNVYMHAPEWNNDVINYDTY